MVLFGLNEVIAVTVVLPGICHSHAIRKHRGRAGHGITVGVNDDDGEYLGQIAQHPVQQRLVP